MKPMHPIAIKPANKGKLRQKLDVPMGENIPAAKLAQAKNSPDPATRKQATFAANSKKWDHKGAGKRMPYQPA